MASGDFDAGVRLRKVVIMLPPHVGDMLKIRKVRLRGSLGWLGKDASKASRASIFAYMGRYTAPRARDVTDGQLMVAHTHHAIWASAEPVPNCEAMKLRTRVKST